VKAIDAEINPPERDVEQMRLAELRSLDVAGAEHTSADDAPRFRRSVGLVEDGRGREAVARVHRDGCVELRKDERWRRSHGPVDYSPVPSTRSAFASFPRTRYVPRVVPVQQKQPRDEELEELPPLDGGKEDDVEDPAPDLEDEEVPKGGEDPFDDKTGDPTQGDGTAELELSGSEGGWLEEADAAEGLDIGDAELLSEEADLLRDNEEPGTGNEDYGIGDDEVAQGTDGGEEGPGDDDEELREEDLPRLDADEGGSPDDEDFVEDGFGADEEALGVPWGAARWERVGAPLEVGPVRSLALVAGGLLVGGSGLFRVDLEGGVEKLAASGLAGGDVTGVWAVDGAVWVTTEEGELYASKDQGKTFQKVIAWRALVRPDEAAAGIQVAAGGGGLWGRTAQGTLLFSGDLGATFEVVDAGGFVAALDSDALGMPGDVVAVVRTLRGGEMVRWRAHDSAVHAALTGALETAELAGPLRVATRGVDLALSPESTPVSVSLDGGATWARAPKTATATAIAWSKGEGLLVGLYDERQERAYLAHVSPGGQTNLLAEMTAAPPDVEGGIQALAYDEARGVVWVAGGFGVTALAARGAA
jgi:hypothetical protein